MIPIMFQPVQLAIPFISEAIDKVEQAFIGTPTKAILKSAFSDNVLTNLANLMKLSSSNYTKAFDVINNVIDITIPIGIALILTFFLIYLMGVVSRDALTLDVFIKSLITLVVVFALASSSKDIIRTVLQIGDAAVTQTSQKAGITDKNGNITDDDDNSKKATRIAAIKETGANLVKDQHAGALVIALIVWAVAKLSQIGMYIAVISRAIELLWRSVLLPIGIANCFDGGGNSPGIRFLKQYLAVALAGAVAIIIIAIGQGLALGILDVNSNLGGCLLACAALMASAGASMSASSKVKEAIG